jgi:protein involved in polysaccharide export with SLBB domain
VRAGRLAAAGLVASLLIASVPGGVAAQTLVPPASASSSFGLPPEPSSTATQGQATASPYTTAVAPAAPPQPVTIQDSTTAQTTPGAQPSATQPSAGAQTTVSPVQTLEMLAPVRPVAKPGEFEKYVAATLGEPIPRFGAALMLPAPPLGAEPFTPPTTAIVPPDYLLNPGDEIVMGLTGSVEGEIHLTIDSNGRVFLPHIGPVDLAGVRYGDLQALLTRRVGQQYRNFKLSVAIGQLHGITVYVTGYAVTPGAYTLSSLSTLVNAVIASGGPNAGGSFRNIELRRGGEVVTDFDFYDLLLRGDKTHDATLQNEDVIFIGPTGPQAAITGSVNQQAIYEAKSGETLADLLQDAGGFSSLSDRSRVFVERLSTLDTTGWQQLDLSSALPMPIERGDILRVTSVADYARPQERQAIVVKIEGEVDHPGRYYLKPDSTLGDLLAQAGGLTPRAFLFGTELDRVTVRKQQQAGFDQAVDNLELSVAAAPLGASPALNGDLGTQNSRAQLARQVIEQLRAFQPSGRLVLGMTIQSTALPADFLLENDDRIYIPPTPTSVGVFGAVYEPGSFAFQPARHIGDYLRQSGGPDKIADRSDVFVVRANGAVISTRQQGWGSSLASQPALPGDVIFVPVRTQPNLFWDRLVQVTSVLYNVALGAAAIKVLGQ